jgi:hypothetical protein
MRGLLLSAMDKKEVSYKHRFVKRSMTGYATMPDDSIFQATSSQPDNHCVFWGLCSRM